VQRQVSVQNSSGTRILGPSGTAFPSVGSSEITIGLYWGALGVPEAFLSMLPDSAYEGSTIWSPFAGIFNRGLATFPVPGGTQIALQVRAWASGYSSYEAAAADLALIGKANVQMITLGNAPGIPAPSPPANLTSPTGSTDTPFRGFLLTPIPEPSSFALGLLGLSALALSRRCKGP
jgi:hypothetical protein